MNQAVMIFAALAGVLLIMRGQGSDAAQGDNVVETKPNVSPVSGDSSRDLNDLYQIHGRRQQIDPKLLKAIARVESDERPNAVNPKGPSLGVMQVLCQGASGEHDMCQNKLNIQGWPALKGQLFNPNININIASQILRWNIDTYGFKRGIATYNAFSARHDPPEGPFRNQEYVDKVLKEYRGLGGVIPKR